jgi:hypothetical protein
MQKAGWDGVRARVERLQRTHARAAVFGANGHGFELTAPLSPVEVAEVEKQLGVLLPAEYRTFLMEVAGGGAGPAYGIFPLSQGTHGRWTWHGDGADLTDLSTLGTVFSPGDLSGEQQRLRAVQPDTDDEESYEIWLDRGEDLLWAPGRTAGAICLCHEGCAHRRWLVVTGPQGGRIWTDERASDEDLTPALGPDGRPWTFRAWYLEWLDQAEATDY